jgi:hypothetical protein
MTSPVALYDASRGRAGCIEEVSSHPTANSRIQRPGNLRRLGADFNKDTEKR